MRASQFHVDYEHFMAQCYVWAVLACPGDCQRHDAYAFIVAIFTLLSASVITTAPTMIKAETTRPAKATEHSRPHSATRVGVCYCGQKNNSSGGNLINARPDPMGVAFVPRVYLVYLLGYL